MILPLGSTGNAILYSHLRGVNNMAVDIIAGILKEMGDFGLTAGRDMLFQVLFYIEAAGK